MILPNLTCWLPPAMLPPLVPLPSLPSLPLTVLPPPSPLPQLLLPPLSHPSSAAPAWPTPPLRPAPASAYRPSLPPSGVPTTSAFTALHDAPRRRSSRHAPTPYRAPAAAPPPDLKQQGLLASRKEIPRIGKTVADALLSTLIKRHGYDDQSALRERDRYIQWIEKIGLAVDPAEHVDAPSIMRELLAVDTAVRGLLLHKAAATPSDIETAAMLSHADRMTSADAQWAYMALVLTRLYQWADVARTPLRRPLEILSAVSDHHVQVADRASRSHPLVPQSDSLAAAPAFDGTPNANLFGPVQTIFDQSALLHFLLQDDLLPLIRQPQQSSSPLQTLRVSFNDAVLLDTDVQKVMDQLLVRPAPDKLSTTVYFDGISLVNARGLQFADIEALPEIQLALDGLPDGVSRTECLRRKFASIGESSRYYIGSVGHSLASMEIKLRLYGKLPYVGSTADAWQLYQHLLDADRHWPAQRNFYAAPYLVLAMHLAGSAGAIMRQRGWQQQIWREHILPAVLLARTSDSAWPWSDPLRTLLRDIEAAAPSDQHQAARIEQLLFALRAAAHPASELWQGVRSAAVHALRGATLVGDDDAARRHAYIGYVHHRLLGVFGKLPVFNPAQAVRQYLIDAGFSNSRINKRSHYSLAGFDINMIEWKTGNLVEEFIARARAIPNARGLYLNKFSVRDTRKQMEVLKQQFVERRAADPVVLARAWELVSMITDYRAVDPLTVAAVVHQDLEKLPSEDRLEFRRNLHLVWEPLPFIGSSYTIYQGVRDRDAAEIVGGVVMLGVDTLMLLVGGESEGEAVEQGVAAGLERGAARSAARAAASASDRATVDALERINGLRGAPAERAELAEFDALNDVDEVRAGPSSRRIEVEVNDDPYRIRLNRPGSAPLTEGPAATLTLEDVTQGKTVSSVRAYMEKCVSSDPLDDFNAAFDAMFEEEILESYSVTRLRPVLDDGEILPPDPADIKAEPAFKPKRFFRKAYYKSQTFRRLFNTKYLDAMSQGAVYKKWKFELVDKVSESRTNMGTRTIHVPKKGADLDIHYVSAQGPRPATLDRVYRHEMNHMMTNLPDPTEQLALVERGPIVLLTDRQMLEQRIATSPRIIYTGLRQDVVPTGYSDWSRLSGPTARARVEYENRALQDLFPPRSNRIPRWLLGVRAGD